MEIERKYKVTSHQFINESFKMIDIKQGFLNSNPNRTVRVRINESQGFLTIKGKSSFDGLVRFEFEKEIEKNDAMQLLNLCEPGIIDKKRYLVNFLNYIIEVDVFSGENEGLIIAEIELNDVSDNPQLPEWIGEEVTGDVRYYNSYLSKNPFKSWQNS